ncbi:MAG: flavin-containing monooxygenase [Oceanococcus sp.]
MSTSIQTSPDNLLDVIVIGAGVSGLGAGIRLLGDGFINFLILEKASSLGGTWRDNNYPGCECDVPSALYSYSFEQKGDWSQAFAGHAEILSYLEDTARRYELESYIRYEQPMQRAQWQEDGGYWLVKTPGGEYHSRTLVSCAGYLHEPIIPNIPGLKDFPGKIFHSSRWDHQHDLQGERVAVIGTGASAIQFVPKITPLVKSLAIFQRTAQWVLPKTNPPITAGMQAWLSKPWLGKGWRNALYLGFESFGIGFRRPALLRKVQKLAERHVQRRIRDPELRRKLTPDYTLGCKRVLMSNDYYPAVRQSHVELHATGVSQVQGHTVIGADGSQAEVDTIILGTGFFVTEPPISAHLFDQDGRSLAQLWSEKMQAYRGTTIAGMPNAFMVLGPNLGIGHNSAFIVIEAQLDYIMSALRKMRKQNLSRIEVRAEVQERYNEHIQKHLQGTVWNSGGCSSYYLDANGFNSVGFPWGTMKMRRMLKSFDVENYATQKAPAVSMEKAA